MNTSATEGETEEQASQSARQIEAEGSKDAEFHDTSSSRSGQKNGPS